MSGLLWDAATSAPTFALLATIIVVAFVIGHIPAIGRIPALAPYVAAAQLIKLAAICAAAFLAGFTVADDRAEVSRLHNEVAWKDFQLGTNEATARDAAALRQAAESRAADAMGKLDEWRKRYGDKPEAACAFGADDLERLRQLKRNRAISGR